MKCNILIAEKHNPSGRLFLHKSCGVCGWKKVEEFHRPEQIFEKPTECAAQAKAYFDMETTDFVATVLASANPRLSRTGARLRRLAKGKPPVKRITRPQAQPRARVRRGSFPPPCADITLRILYVDMNTATGNRHA